MASTPSTVAERTRTSMHVRSAGRVPAVPAAIWPRIAFDRARRAQRAGPSASARSAARPIGACEEVSGARARRPVRAELEQRLGDVHDVARLEREVRRLAEGDVLHVELHLDLLPLD